MLAAARRGLDSGQRKDAQSRAPRPFRHRFLVVSGGAARGGEGAQNRNGQAGFTAWCVDREIRGTAQPRDACTILAPRSEALAPALRLLACEVVCRDAGAPRLVFVDPRPEIFLREVREGQQQVRDIPLRIDGDHGHAVDCGLFDQGKAQPGLATPRHADADAVRHEVTRVVQDGCFELFLGVDVVVATDVEDAELLEVLHMGIVAGNE